MRSATIFLVVKLLTSATFLLPIFIPRFTVELALVVVNALVKGVDAFTNALDFVTELVLLKYFLVRYSLRLTAFVSWRFGCWTLGCFWGLCGCRWWWLFLTLINLIDLPNVVLGQ